MSKLNENKTRGFGKYLPFPQKGVKFANSFFPYFTRLWNSQNQKVRDIHDINDFKIEIKQQFKPKKQRHYSRGNKLANSLLCRLRVGRSFLKAHSYSINLADDDKCLCHQSETVNHYLLHCFLFNKERDILISKVESIYPKYKSLSNKQKESVLLFGINLDNEEPDPRNYSLTFAVQNYILQTNRFKMSFSKLFS